MQPAGGYGGAKPAGADKKIAAGLCGILLGGFGVHKFVLGYQQEGIILLSVYLIGLVITIITCGVGFFIPLAAGIVAASEALAGRVSEAERAARSLDQLDPSLRVSNLRDWVQLRRPEDLDLFADELRRSGLPE